MATLEKSFWDVEVEVSETVINEKNKIVVKNVSKNGTEYVDVRKYFMNKQKEWQHGKGMSIPVECADDVAKIIKQALKAKKASK